MELKTGSYAPCPRLLHSVNYANFKILRTWFTVVPSELYVFISSKMQELALERKVLQELLPTLARDTFKLRTWVFEGDAPATADTASRPSPAQASVGLPVF